MFNHLAPPFTRLWELDVCIRFGLQSLEYICTHTGVKLWTLSDGFASGDFHPLVARLTAATGVGFHSCASRVSLLALGLNHKYGIYTDIWGLNSK